MRRGIDPARLARLRAATQLLHRPASARIRPRSPARSPAPRPRTSTPGPLTFRSRSRRLTAADITRARTEERSLLRTWVMRKTVHLIPTDDAGWLLPLFEPGIERWSRRRLEQLGMPAASRTRRCGCSRRRSSDEGPLTRTEARRARRRRRASSSTRRPACTSSQLAIVAGVACLGPDRGKPTCLVRREDWLGKPPRVRPRPGARRARAPLHRGRFGPADERDFAYWSGLPLRDVRAGLGVDLRELEEVRVGDETMLVAARRACRGSGARASCGCSATSTPTCSASRPRVRGRRRARRAVKEGAAAGSAR